VRAIVVVVAALALVASAAAAPTEGGVPVVRGTTAQDFALRDQNGRVIRLSGQRGRIVLLTFLYTNCPDVCPLVASNLNAVLRSLPAAQRNRVRVLAVSVDPAHDTPQAVRAFARAHALLPQFHYLVGAAGELRPVWQAYNVLTEVQNVERVSHSAYVLLLDRTGKPRLYYRPSVGAEAVLRDVRRLL
jgi:protein SCO1